MELPLYIYRQRFLSRFRWRYCGYQFAQLKDLFLKYKKLTRSQVMEITKVGPSTATKDLAVLLDAGFIVRKSPTKSPRTDYFEMVE